ncbi:MAG: glycosyltransferase [Candidatus Sumerlaeota bacterium]|nr:glycosyltransferase [Candidatus Sumerlaeota bacterium]
MIRASDEKRLRVLHVYKDIYPPVVGGIEKHIHDVCLGLRDQFDFTIMVAYNGWRCRCSDVEGIPLLKVGTFGRFFSAPISPAFPWRLWLQARRHDVIHYHTPNPTAEISHLLVRPRAPAVVTYHSDVVRQAWAMKFYGLFFRAFLRRMRMILPTSPRYMEFSPFLREFRPRCRVIPLGIDTAAYKETPAMQAAARRIRAQYGNVALVGFVGKLRAYKGLEYLIDAMTDVEPHEAKCLIIGDGPMRKSLEAQVRQRGIERRVQFLGEVPDEEIPALLHAIDVFCLPSYLRSEAFGLAQVEAMACGTPVVSCNIETGVPWVNQDRETGIVAGPMSPDSLVRALNEILGDPMLKRKLGEGARERATHEFDRARMLRRIAEVYREVARPRP